MCFIKRTTAGFSLIEILISVGILSAMTLLIYSTMNRSLQGKARIERKDELVHSVRIAMSKMVEDMSQAFLTHDSLKGKDLKFDTGLKGTDEKINFSTMSHYHYVVDAKDTDQVSVGYYIEKNDRGFHTLMRRESQRLSDKIDEGGRAVMLIDNVKEMKFEYYDSNKGEWVAEWDTSKISALGRLPQAIKIQLIVVELEHDESREVLREYTYSTIAMIDLYRSALNF